MGKHLWSKNSDDQFEDNHPGCMWGILHALDYHHWHYNVKKILPHKKHDGRRHAKGNGRRKKRLNIHDSGEMQNLLDAETSHFLVDQGTTKTSSTNKRSLKARIKSLIAEEMPKEEDHKQLGSGVRSQSRLRQTYSIHHLEPSDHGLDETSSNWNHTLLPEKCNKARETLVNQKLIKTKQLSGNASQYQFKECEDILELFKVKKELFLEILQNADDGIKDCFHSLQTSNRRTRLTKSGSFPVADLSLGRKFWPSKLEQKQNEIRSFRKGEKLLAGNQAPVLIASKFPEDLYTKSAPLMANDSGGSVLNEETSCLSLGSTQALDKKGSSEVVKDIKQRIELMVERWKEDKMGTDSRGSSSSCHETDGSVCDLSQETLTHTRRTSYINESMDRYARLFDYSFSREAKWPRSKSLKLTNEYEIQPGDCAPISFRRIHSLPHFDSYCSLRNEVSRNAHLAEMSLPVMNVVDNCTNVESDCHDEPKPVILPASTEKCVSLDANEETECLNDMVKETDGSKRMEYLASLTVGINDEETAKMDGLSQGMDEFTVGESNSQKEEEIAFMGTGRNKLPQPSAVSVIQSCFQEDVTTPAEFPVSEGLECSYNYFDEKESSVNSQNRSNTDSLTRSCSTVNPENDENANNSVKNHSHIESYTRDDADFNYVREILERLGFMRNSFLGTWHLPDQPLNPLVFEEVEACWHHELECSGEDICTCCHHQLLFDLVNEAFLQIYDRSFTYYPRALSFSCRIRPMPVEHRVLEEVWASISRSISLRQELDESLDCVVDQDLAKDDVWMNLQLETECVALELEDLIFDQLLGEFISSLDY